MADDKFMAEVVAAAFAGIDVASAREVLRELDLPPRYSDESIAAIHAASEVFVEKAIALKRREAPVAERKAVRLKVDRLTNARALLFRLRVIQPGDVTVTPTPVGGNN